MCWISILTLGDQFFKKQARGRRITRAMFSAKLIQSTQLSGTWTMLRDIAGYPIGASERERERERERESRRAMPRNSLSQYSVLHPEDDDEPRRSRV